MQRHNPFETSLSAACSTRERTCRSRALSFYLSIYLYSARCRRTFGWLPSYSSSAPSSSSELASQVSEAGLRTHSSPCRTSGPSLSASSPPLSRCAPRLLRPHAPPCACGVRRSPEGALRPESKRARRASYVARRLVYPLHAQGGLTHVGLTKGADKATAAIDKAAAAIDKGAAAIDKASGNISSFELNVPVVWWTNLIAFMMPFTIFALMCA